MSSMYPMPAIAIEVSHFIIIIVIIVAFHAPSTHLSYSLLQNAKDDANDKPLKESMHAGKWFTLGRHIIILIWEKELWIWFYIFSKIATRYLYYKIWNFLDLIFSHLEIVFHKPCGCDSISKNHSETYFNEIQAFVL